MKRQLARMLLMLIQTFAVSHNVQGTGFSGTYLTVCIVRERAIVFYKDRLYVAEPGTAVISRDGRDRPYTEIVNRLTEEVQLIRRFAAAPVDGADDLVNVGTVLKLDGIGAGYYFSPTDDGGVTLIKGKKEEASHWLGVKVGGEALPHELSASDHALKDLRSGRFIVVSTKEVMTCRCYHNQFLIADEQCE